MLNITTVHGKMLYIYIHVKVTSAITSTKYNVDSTQMINRLLR